MLFVVFITGCSSVLNSADSSNADLLSDPDFVQTKNEIDSIVSQIAERHSVRIYYRKRPVFILGGYKYKLAPKSEYTKVLKYLKILQKELNKYPKTFLQRAGIKRIVVCKELSSWGYSAGGLPEPGGKAVYYNYAVCSNVSSQRTVHHELYHMIEAKFNSDTHYKDPDWAKLNGRDFKYGKGGRRFKWNDSNRKKPFHPKTGFVTAYATSALEEDKAEVYAGLFVEEISACLHDWIREDEILRNKVNYMKDFLLRCCDGMTSDFWDNFSAGECSPLRVTAVDSYEIEDSRFSAVLSDDTVAEFIAITEDSGNAIKWWKPNGEMFDEAPFIIDDSETGIADELKQYRFFVRAKTDQSSRGFYTWDLPEGQIYRIQQPYFGKDGRIFLDVCVMICGLDGDKETSQLRIGAAVGEWVTKATYNPKTKATSGPDKEVKFHKPYIQKGKLKIEVSHVFSDLTEMAEKTVAVDLVGEKHLPESSEGEFRIDRNERKMSLSFGDLRLEQIREFQFQTCPYTWVTFENISLGPGRITDVQIKIENN
jgi:hypothetical protein